MIQDSSPLLLLHSPSIASLSINGFRGRQRSSSLLSCSSLKSLQLKTGSESSTSRGIKPGLGGAETKIST